MPGSPAPASEPVAAPGFEAVYQDCFDFVWRSLLRLGVPERSVDDAAHDVFLVVHRRLSDFEGRSSVRTWLFGIAWRVANQYRARERRHAGTGAEDADPPDSERRRPEAQLARREAAELVQRLLERLVPERRAVLVAVEIEELSVPEVAEALLIPLNTAYSRLRLARRDFERALRRLEAQERGRERCTV